MRKAIQMPDQATSSPYYSPAVRAGDFVFVSGQGPWDRKSGMFVEGPLEQQTEITLENVKAVLKAANASMDDVVQVHVHLRDINDFDRFNLVYTRYFSDPKPARITVGSDTGNILVEIDVIAYTGP